MVKKITTSVQDVFIPEWDGNKDAPLGEQIQITYKAVTVAMKEKLFPREFDYKQANTGSQDMLTSMVIKVDRKKVIAEMTVAIKNCAYETAEGEIKKVATVEQLFATPIDFDPLIEELYTFYQSLLTQKVNEKN